jgi:hypothetical protein
MRFLCWVALGLCALSSACVDPKKEYDDFNDRLADKKARDEDAAMHMHMDVDASACMPVTAEQAEGTYLFALRIQGYEKQPIVNALTLSNGVMKGSDVELDFSLQPLKTADLKTPVGTPTTGKALLKDGVMFALPKATVVTPGDADPVAPGFDVTSLIDFKGTLCGDGQPVQWFCGTSDGDIVDPLMQSIDGSTVTVQRITGADYPKLAGSCAELMKAMP